MAMDPISFGMLFTSGFSGWQQYEAGREAEQAYQAQAGEIANQTAYAQRMALEEMKDIHREGQAAQGQAIAAAGKSGLRVGGSVVTLSQAIARKVERRKALVGMQFNETARRNLFLQEQYRYAGKSARKAGEIEAFGSLLTGGLALARRKEKLGTTWGGLFDIDERKRNKLWQEQQARVYPAH